MDKEARNRIQRATQDARAVLERDLAEQLEGTFDIRLSGAISAEPGSHLDAEQRVLRAKLVAAVEHLRGGGRSAAEAVTAYLREAAFTTLNRFVALKMLEARGLVQECVSRGDQSAGFKEFTGLAPGLVQLADGGYRLYIETLFDEIGREVRVLFDRRDPGSALWPRRQALVDLLGVLNATDLAEVWAQDETIGWVYQYFNGDDERKRMRDPKQGGSQVPRNSRELAVRNQFFTPRYVVEFLTDNTLGRIWYEMRGGNTVLAERCEYMVRRPDEAYPPREKKDPRDLRVLDPACGSGHFLLYAFELLLAMYEEAWADSDSPKSEATGRRLADDYPAAEDLRRALPGLILADNLHGVDIDPRCAQIAQLALWMRSQRAYQDFGVDRGDRPLIRRTNIIVAEPLATDDRLAEEFIASLGDPELGRVFSNLVEDLKLAGDLGLLLRLERLVARAPERGKTGDLFAPPEARLRSALARFAASGATTRRRLFIDDAVQGLGLLEVAEKKYDAVLMNPPFGDGSTRAKALFEKEYRRAKNDVYAAFVERGIELLGPRSRLGAITSRTGFFLSSFQKWRESMLLRATRPSVCADLGLGVMDGALVEAAAYCLERAGSDTGELSVFFRVLEERHDKEAALRAAIQAGSHGRNRFDVDPQTFMSVPGCPFAYWASDRVSSAFKRFSPFENAGRAAKQGLATADDFRFIRAWWETAGACWLPLAKGGRYSPFYLDLHLILNWGNGGAEISNFYKPGTNRLASRPQNTEHFLRPGLTWTRRTKSDLSLREMPAGCAFGDKGPAAFALGDDPTELLVLLSLMNTKAFRNLVEFQLAAAEPTGRGGVARSYEVGVVQRTPVPSFAETDVGAFGDLARRAWFLMRSLDTVHEVSHAFLLPSGLNELVTGLDRAAIEREIVEIQREIDERAFELYGFGPEDGSVIQDRLPAEYEHAEGEVESDVGDEDDSDDTGAAVDDAPVAPIRSWLVGVAFGRFDKRLATGDRAVPPEPEPFDPLPARSPGMWPDGEPHPASPPDILVDDPGHERDLVAHVVSASTGTGVELGDELRRWYAREFFPLHIKMYSKSRRKAPIYWQLATSSASYSVWLYIHAFTRDTLYRVLNDYVGPKLTHEERRLDALTAGAADASAPERRELAAQQTFVEELRALRDEVARVAPLWNPDLDDGVLINFAPFWRLVPQHRSWQKEVKACWDRLVDGEYDWSHLAMHLWPERVVPKCAEDRSIAIAHGLESAFWEEADGKWKQRKVDPETIERLVKERTSAAVKDALASLQEAPAVAKARAGRAAGTRTRSQGSSVNGKKKAGRASNQGRRRRQPAAEES